MRLPRRAEVGPHIYKIIVKNSMSNLGETDHERLRIWLRTENVDPVVIVTTLLHEVLHAIFCQLELDLTDKEEEDMVRRITPVLFDVLRSNPEIVELLYVDS